MEMPTIPEPDNKKIFTQMWVGQLTSATGFIMQKLGTDALEEYNDLIADQSAAQLRAMGVESPVDFAISQAVCCANIFGSDVDVIPEADGSATLDIKECANLRTALEFAKTGHADNEGAVLRWLYKRLFQENCQALGTETDSGIH